MAPTQAAAYRVLWAEGEESDVLREGDDLPALLAWALQRPQGHFELRRADGALLAQVG